MDNETKKRIEDRRARALADARITMGKIKAEVDKASALLNDADKSARGLIGTPEIAAVGALLPRLIEAMAMAAALEAGPSGRRYEVRPLGVPMMVPTDCFAHDADGKPGLRNVYTGRMETVVDRVEYLLNGIPDGTPVVVTVTAWHPMSEDGLNWTSSAEAFKAAVESPRFHHVSRRRFAEAGPDWLCVYYTDPDSPAGYKLAASVLETGYTRSLVLGTVYAGGQMGNR